MAVNAFAYAVIVTSFATFQRYGAKHKRIRAVFALILMIACGSITIMTLAGCHAAANLAETIVNGAICFVVIQARGNTMKIFAKVRRI